MMMTSNCSRSSVCASSEPISRSIYSSPRWTGMMTLMPSDKGNSWLSGRPAGFFPRVMARFCSSISCNLFRMLSSAILSLLLHHLFRLQSGFYRQELLVFLEFAIQSGIVIFQSRHFLVNYFELTEYALLLLQAFEGNFLQFFITQLVHIDSLPSFFGTRVPYCRFSIIHAH